MVTLPSSRGWRIRSNVSLRNSGSSSRNSTPLWLMEISPGLGLVPPPTRPALDTVWWGLRKGRFVTMGSLALSVPMTEQIWVISSASSQVISGKIPGRRFESILLPEPGGPMSSTLWLPAAATSRARFTFSWPRTSLKSRPMVSAAVGSQFGSGCSTVSPFKPAASSRILRMP